ncbi:Syntaxin-binding protein 5 [Rhizoctonia solani]|uniref:Syntaxin-binding protein 5 n=1 Tax=Rhizoctonia solani TaxID=456999 RepID=A0A0K6GBH0_9AGAM|nr:Syntaxin-binding protein 5 [Rhizoctonia solani]
MGILTSEEGARVLDTFPSMDQLEIVQKQAEANSGMHRINFWMMEGCLYLDHSLTGSQGARLYLDSVIKHLTLQVDSLLEMEDLQDQAGELEMEIIIFYLLRIIILGTIESIDKLIEWGTRVSREPSCSVTDSIVLLLLDVGPDFLHRSSSEGGPNADMSIECHTRAIKLLPESHPIMPSLLASLGNSYYWRATHENLPPEGVHANSIRAIQCYRAAVVLTSPQDQEYTDTLKGLGALLQKQMNRIERSEDIGFVIECASQIAEGIPEGNPILSYWLDTLARFFYKRFELFSNPEDADQAIASLTKAVSLQPSDPTLLFELHVHLGITHTLRHQEMNQVQDIDAAIKCYHQALLLAPKQVASTSPYSLGFLLTAIGNVHWKRFFQTGDSSELKMVIEYHCRAIPEIPEGHPRLAANFTGVGVSYLNQHECTGNPDDLSAALDWIHRAFQIAPEDPQVLAHLGSCYMHRFAISGGLEDIDESINHFAKALTLPLEETSRVMTLNNLGQAYRHRYLRLNNREDLEKSMRHFNSAVIHVEAMKNPLSALPGILSNLGVSYVDRYKIIEEQEDIDKAIQHLKHALSFGTHGPGVISSLFVNLGTALMSRYYTLNDDEDVNETIRLLTDGLAQIPADNPSRTLVLSNLGVAHLHRSEKHPNPDDISKAISLLSQASVSSPPEHSSTARLFNLLGKAYRARFKDSGDTVSLHCSLDHFRRAAQHLSGHPHIRFYAALAWAKAASLDSHSELLRAYQTAMDLVPQLVWLGMNIKERYSQEVTQAIGRMALEAAAVAITLEKYEMALEWLEQGRSVVWSQTLQLRTPLDELALVDASLATELKSVARELHEFQSMDRSTITVGLEKSPEASAQRHRYLAKHYEEIVGKIRQLPGFETFLQPKRAAELLSIPQKGPVVMVNIHELRCDALILIPGKSEITHVPLPDFSPEKAITCRTQMESSHISVRDRGFKRIEPVDQREERFQQVLLELWLGIVRPVLDCLGYRVPQRNVDSLPHITWCTTGALSFLPLHAAGCYDQPQARIFDYVISSYTPTLSGLVPKSSTPIEQRPRLLLVGQENTPGRTPLPGTRQELSHIRKHAQAPLSYIQLDGSEATREAVLNAMEEHEWIHLACHAHQNLRNPLDSGFFLHDGTLSLLQMSRKELKGKGLAFLSACHTAKGDKELSEEAIHLASGMLMAGYAAVIATMWSVVDEDAPLIADVVYGQLIESCQGDHRGAARALHVAVEKLREKVGVEAFVRWVPYIHIGGSGVE